MGAPKQKWTAEEESALKAGVKKHGIGKWRNILRDPEFSMELRLRSNIDLKDKWRNMTMTVSGWSVSKERAQMANKKSKHALKSKKLEEDGEYNPMAITSKMEDDMVMDVTAIASSSVLLDIESKGTKKPLTRLNNLILEAVTQLHVHERSDNTSIVMYIEGKYWVPPDFQMVLSAKLKSLVNSGKLIKVNENYKLAPGSTALQMQTPRTENNDIRKQKTTQAVAIQEAADSAARAVTEAEIAESEAEEARRKAEKFEAEAQAAQAFVDTMILHLKNRNSAPLMIQA